MPRRTFGRVLTAMVASGALLVASGCGAQEAQVVKTAFDKDIDRATVAVDLSMKAAGERVHVTMTGPYSSNGDKDLPSVDWRITATGATPKPLEARVISTAKNAFVEYAGQTYEVGEQRIAQMQKQGGGQETSPADMRKLLKAAKSWFPQSDTQENARLGGEDVTRVTGRLDLSKALPSIMDLAPKGSGVTDAELKQLTKYVADPRFTLDAAKSDGSLRRIVASMQLRQAAGGGSIRFSMRFSDVGKPVAITAPTSGRPIEELEAQLKKEAGFLPGAGTTS